MRLSDISLFLGLGALVAANVDGSDDACLSEWQVCPPLKPLVDAMLGFSNIKEICQQIDPEARGPATVTITDSLPVATITTTSYRTVGSFVTRTSSVVAVVTQSSQAVVTNRFSSAAIQSVRVTATAIDTETVPITETNTVTQTQKATVTQTSTLTTEEVISQTVTTTVTVTSASPAVPTMKRRGVDLPEMLQSYSDEDLLEACWCVEFDTVTVTTTLPPTTQTQTIVIASTVPSSVAVIRTIDETDTIVGTTTVDLTTIITQLSTVTTTATLTEQTTVYATVDQTADVTDFQTVTATATFVDEYLTVTVPATATTTVTPAPTNVLGNAGFTGGTISPWTRTLNYFYQNLDSTCNGMIYTSSNCIYFSDFTGGSVGTFTLTQTINTYVGQYYSVQFQYMFPYAVPSMSTFKCTAGSTTFPIPTNIIGSFQPVSGGFTATASTTTFTCSGQATANNLYIFFYGFDIRAASIN
ncbi:hypothetical protein TMatcc_000097 [Talaromyces marneffei ATCC 18224]|uniref:Serine/threonine-rich protein adg2, putative n=1 Tax=Talaromyces marneffei (strain ATCC 18224 / CBS 334.59 / QM 7333) TaxID=441960 RepID=B6QPZ9_TALMQ|nr:serine/threonine-rich protein adg2 precursor, putative [Talaromyces marneffei ATCC 18224]KAE8549137.1 hypothetical protein EYB25_007652 [Talaromyces marneffei]